MNAMTVGVHVDTIDAAVLVETISAGCTTGLSIVLTPDEALELQGQLGKAILTANHRSQAA